MNIKFKKKIKVIIAMSGGVDSSVSAWILKKKGYHVEALFMKNWEEDDTKEYCNSLIDLQDSKKVCKKLKIKLHTINFSYEYWENVFKLFISKYKLGKTPNPDILCNKKIKFNSFLKYSINVLGANYIATGHYVRKKIINNSIKLFCGLDKNKDQSYFLHTLTQKQIKSCLFPIGNLNKYKVREIANNLNLPNAKKKDSTGICFIGKRNFNTFISNYIKFKSGKIKTIDGKEIGEHKGIHFYTIGQRKGLKIGGIKNFYEKPWYVAKKNLINNELIVVQGRNNSYLKKKKLFIKKIHWISDKPKFPFKCLIKIRYRDSKTKCLILKKSDDFFQINFEKPLFAITPGQSAVFYNSEQCLGGGIIEK